MSKISCYSCIWDNPSPSETYSSSSSRNKYSSRNRNRNSNYRNRNRNRNSNYSNNLTATTTTTAEAATTTVIVVWPVGCAWNEREKSKLFSPSFFAPASKFPFRQPCTWRGPGRFHPPRRGWDCLSCNQNSTKIVSYFCVYFEDFATRSHDITISARFFKCLE